MAAQDLGEDAHQIVHRFFENLFPYTTSPENVNSWVSTQYDNFSFIVYELFMLMMTDLIKREHFIFAEAMLRENYILPSRMNRNDIAASFSIFQDLSMGTLNVIDQQSGQRKVSFRAYFVGQRLANTGLAANDLAQADLVLAIRARATGQFWWPEHVIYADRHRTMTVFARCASKKFFGLVSPMLGTDEKALKALVQQIDDEGGFFKGLAVFGPKASMLVGEEKLCTSS